MDLFDPFQHWQFVIEGVLMLAVAIVGIAGNVAAIVVFSRHRR